MKKSKVTSGCAGSIMNVSVTFTFNNMSSEMAQRVIAGLDFGKERRITSPFDKDKDDEIRVWMNKVSIGSSHCAVTVQVHYERSGHLPVDEQVYGLCEKDAEDFVFNPLKQAFKGHDVPRNRIETPPAPAPATAPAPAPAPATGTAARRRR